MSRTRAALLAACALLSGCLARGPLLAPALPPDAAGALELGGTPFHPQEAFQCGPAALATVLGAAGVPVDPGSLAPQVYLPARRGSLQIELQVAARRLGRLPYTLAPDLAAVLAELRAHRPVLVLHDYGLPFWPRWHYAVVVGYDAAREELVLRSGTQYRQVLRARDFLRAWDGAGRWAMVVLRPGELPRDADRATYLEAAAAFERLAAPIQAQRAFEAALGRWPDEPLAWIGRGTARYAQRDPQGAARDYTRALRLAPGHAGARNNLAMSLLELGCPRHALEHLERIDPVGAAPLHAAIADTRRQVLGQVAVGAVEPAACAAFAP